ncbi:two-component regulator propeller domain-containing protein [Melioribacter sp. OK-1-Me]|uniref:two-component regulator propeller domain-containing protein n=1 Tax=Melioribacter sp. OK-1-Me TaxID=3461410 RepID=UPI0040445909
MIDFIKGQLPVTYILFFLTLYFKSGITTAQEYRFEHLTSEDGLSQNTVLCIFQDSEGFLWFGTFDGLNRYDGFGFKVYKTDPDDSTSILGQGFYSIVEDKNKDLWIASLGEGLNRYIRSQDKFSRYRREDRSNNPLISNRVRALLYDSKGRLWIGTEKGLCRYDFETDRFIDYTQIIPFHKYERSEYITSLAEDSTGIIWVGAWNGLIKFNPENNSSEFYFNIPGNDNSLQSNFVNALFVDKRGQLWLGTSEGLHRYSSKNNNFIRYYNPFTAKSPDKTIRSIIEDDDGNLWIATNINGLFRFDKSKEKFTSFHYQHNNPYSLNSNNVFSLYKDNGGIIWIGTNGGGVNKLDFKKSRFRFVNLPDNDSYGNPAMIYSILEDKNGYLWIGTYGNGVYRFNPSRKGFVKFTNNADDSHSLIDNRIRTIYQDRDGEIWISTDQGVSRYDPLRNNFINYTTPQLSSYLMFSITQINTGEILFASYGGGLNIYDKRRKSFIYLKHNPRDTNSIASDNLWVAFQDSKGRIWIGTDESGLDLFDYKNKTFKHFKHIPNNSNSISDNKVLSLFEDSRGNLWVATVQGINRVITDEKGNISFKSYTKKDGLPDNNIQSILEDFEGNLWIGTNKGISKFNPSNNSFINFDKSNGLPSNEYYVRSAVKLKTTGEFIFGGNKGMVMFKPDEIIIDTIPPKVVLTDFELFNSPVKIGDEIDGNVILPKHISYLNEIHLTYKQNVFTIKFAAMNFSAPDKNSYAYKMEGLDNNWYYIGNLNYAVFSRIPPGKYTLYIKAANSFGYWNEKGVKINIIIHPPFYQTWWFRLLAASVILLAIFTSYRLKINSVRKRQSELESLIREKTTLNEKLIREINERKEIEQELLKAKEKAESSEKLKSEFLAQMSHEIRSPINTILNFVDLIRESVDSEKDQLLKESFESIDKAGDRIVRTIDLILNMSELQTGSYETHFKDINLGNLLDELFLEFEHKARKKNLDLVLNVKDVNLTVYADEYSLTQIIINLTDNAIKYTFKGKIEIAAYRDDKMNVTIKISDTGIGISKEYLPYLFSAFSQEQRGYTRQFEGNGLGLALVKRYCEINNADISVESEKGVGTTFTIIFKNKH